MEYYCKTCDKQYVSYKSLWNHNKKFHTPQKTSNYYFTPQKSSKSELSKPIENITSNNLNCKYCNKLCSRLDNLKRHENTCKNKNDIINENEILKKENEMFKKEFDNMKSQLLQILNKEAKIHPKTLQKINKQLNNTGNIGVAGDNNIIVNNTFVKFGPVEFEKVLTNKEILSILNKPFMSLEESVKLIHFNDKLPEYNNIYITNMRDDLAYIFDGFKFISVKKNDLIADLIDNYANEIELSFDNNKDKLKDKISLRVEAFLDLINSDDKYIDNNKKAYSNFKAYKIGDIKRLIYDHSDPKKLVELNKQSLNCKEIDESKSETNIIL